MNLRVFCIHLSLTVLLQYAFSKMLPAIDGLQSELEENDKSDLTAKDQEIHNRILKDIQRSDKEEYTREKRLEGGLNKRKQCAIMYKNEEPIGILQAFQDSYQLLPVHADESIPVEINPIQRQEFDEIEKRDTEALDETANNEVSKFTDEKYPYIFAKFKIDTKVDNQKSKILQKRESQPKKQKPPLLSSKHMSSISSTLLRMQANDEGAQGALRSILHDMGLIEDAHVDEKRDNTYSDQQLDNTHSEENRDNTNFNQECDDSHADEKRDVDIVEDEDEDLELGTNKINMIKFEERPKREKSVTKHYDAIEFPEPKSKDKQKYVNECEEKESEVENKDTEKKSEYNEEKQIKEQTKDKEREKRSENEKKESEEVKNNDREKRSENAEKQMEQQIKERLQKIKEEVKNEMEQIKSNNNNKEFTEDKPEKEDEDKDKFQRKKRNAIKEISSLVDEETSDLNPILFGENNLVPHIRTIRKKRTLDREYAQFEKALDIRNFKRNTQPALFVEKIIDDNLMSANTENAGSLIFDLNSEDEKVDASKKKTFSNNKQKGPRRNYDSDVPQPVTNPYLIRSLKEYREDFNNNYDGETKIQTYDSNFIEHEDEALREKKACKCIGKNCKCGQPKKQKHLASIDGSDIFYFDGAPILAPASDQEKASMNILPSKNSNSDIKTNILRGLKDGGYILDLDPDIYKLTNSEEPREKRQSSFIDLVAIHGGGPVINHLLAIRKRSMFPTKRVKRSANNNEIPLTLSGMSDLDLFGNLPQNYEGELSRYKRVKREK